MQFIKQDGALPEEDQVMKLRHQLHEIEAKRAREERKRQAVDEREKLRAQITALGERPCA